MRINEEIWGSENTWVTAAGTFADVGKVANFNNQGTNLLAAVTQNKLTLSERIQDKSLSWCGMGTESNYGHMKIFANSTDTFGQGERNVDNQEITNFFFYNIPQGENALPQNCIMTGDNAKYIWDSTYTLQNANLYIQPFTEFNIKKVIWLVQVTCSDTVTGTMHTYNYNEYISTYKTTYPVIRYIEAVPYKETSSEPINRVQFSGTYPLTMKPAIFNGYSVYTTVVTDYFGDYAIFSENENCNLLLFGSKAQNTNNRYTIAIGDCKRKYDSPRSTYQDTNIDSVLESALKTIACFGFYFILDSNYINANLDNDNVYMGVIPTDGITHGEYTQGAANRENPNWTMTNTKTSNYDYKKPPADRITVFGSNTLYNTFIQYYAMSPAQLNNLCSVVYTYINSVDTSTEDINKAITKTFYTNNPLDVIVSLKKLPFNIVNYFGISSTAGPVKLGNLANAAATGYKLNGQYTVVNFGSFTVEPAFGNSFLDYSPYTYAELIIPFCGSTRIDAALFMGKTLNLKMVVDLYTGACTCYILVNNLCIDSVSGNCAIDIPVTGIQSADFQNSVQNAITNVKNARLQIKSYERKGNIAMGAIWNGSTSGQLGNTISNIGSSLSAFRNIPSAVTSAESTRVKNDFDLQKANYDLEHVQTPFNSVGSQSAANSYVEEMQARIIIYRPILSDDYDASVYASTVGHACLKEGTVSSFSGLTVGSINVSDINASEQEKQLIQSAFASGVYL